jgi:hypothetical protein
MKHLFEALRNLPELTELYLNDNPIGCEGMIHFIDDGSMSLKNLKILNLINCNIGI